MSASVLAFGTRLQNQLDMALPLDSKDWTLEEREKVIDKIIRKAKASLTENEGKRGERSVKVTQLSCMTWSAGRRSVELRISTRLPLDLME